MAAARWPAGRARPGCRASSAAVGGAGETPATPGVSLATAADVMIRVLIVKD